MSNNWWNDFIMNNKDNDDLKEIIELIDELDNDINKINNDTINRLNDIVQDLDSERYTESIPILNKKIDILDKRRDMRINEDFGSYIRYVRERKGMTLAELGEKANVSGSYINRLENSERSSPSITVVEKIAKGLGVPFYEIAEQSGIELGLEEERSIQSIRDIIMNNEVSYHNMGPEVPNEKKLELLNIVDYIINAEFGKDKSKELDELYKLIAKFRNLEI